MGRSQVERNRIKGRPGGRGGRGRGGSGGGGGRGGRSSRRSGPDPRTLGDNAFRYERTKKDAIIDDDNNDMLLDDFNTGLLLGSDYHGASHYELLQDDDENVPSFENGGSDWMAVDVQAMTACFKQLPLHERLDIPYHVGKHIESRYGTDNAAGGKKTLAELREESKCIVNNETVEDEEVDANQDSPAERKETKEDNNDNNDGDDDDEDDLDAWLDDMIS